MKHLINKNLFQGGGKNKPKPQPPILKPPKLGAYKLLNSYSVAEIVDLISDGPIEGLVNQNNQILGENGMSSILQGVYLDNTPVEQTSVSSQNPINDSDVIGLINISDRLQQLGNIYRDPIDGKDILDFHRGEDGKTIELGDKIKNTKLFQEARLLASNALVVGAKTESYYSPIVEKPLKLGASGNGWQWIGDLNKPASPKYFKTIDTKLLMEVHYENPSISLFSESSILRSLQNSLNSKAATNQQSINSTIQTKISDFQSSLADKSFDWKKTNSVYVVMKFGSSSQDSVALDNGLQENKNFKANPVSFQIKNFSQFIGQNQIHRFLIPILDSSDSVYLNQMYGCLVIELKTEVRTEEFIQKIGTQRASSIISDDYHYYRQILKSVSAFSEKNVQLIFKKGVEDSSDGPTASKYNFSNIACDFRNGDEYQETLNDFKNIYIDFDYGTSLIGPFVPSGRVRRIQGSYKTRGANNPELNQDLVESEGSQDLRTQTNVNYSDWNSDNEEIYDELAIPITHTIENSNVSSVFFTLAISSLRDTAHTDFPNENRSTQDRLPAILEIEVEYGKTTNGKISDKVTKKFAILGMVEGQMLIDFGSPDSPMSDLQSVRDISGGQFEESELNKPFKLPKLNNNEDPSVVKRYIKITKLSAETNSILLSKEASLYKVTEIIENNLSYPFSSVVGVKIDARTFGSVPERTYDCRLKKIKIPSNYKPLDNGKDKRYIKSATEYTTQDLIYDGDWNGTFEEGWTDNPAWIIYDLLTSKRYGLGSYIEESQINKWELYKIGRFCDAVDEQGYFVGVSDGVGGLEPRYSCNIMFKEQTKIFDAINIVASLFRGSVFFSNSEIHFLDDRPRDPIAIFTNSNVKDGLFNYINNRRDQQFNTVEVAYLDRFDNYQTKIEYIQDETDIRNRGIFKTDINTLGVTSRAMARRIGQHLIYQTIRENQSVEFMAGLDALLCRPGDLIIVEDEMKSLLNNYGRILDVDLNNKSLRIDGLYDSGSFTGKVTVYTPTGFASSEDIEQIAYSNRNRVPYFDVTTGLINSSDDILTGRYYFSRYTQGYNSGNINKLPVQFPLYTGTNYPSLQKIFCYYNTGATGFVFSTGEYGIDSDTYNKVICDTGFSDITSVRVSGAELITGYRYSSAASDKRTTPSAAISGRIDVEFDAYKGILNEEINVVNNPQITVFNVTGHQNQNYGSELFIDENDININLLPMIPEGGVYRIQKKNASDQIYKIISIREENQNEYSVYCSKFDTGKFESIEKHITSDYLPDTFYATSPNTQNPIVNLTQLSSPVITNFAFKAGSVFGFTGSWSGVDNASSYIVKISNSNYYIEKEFEVPSTSFDTTGFTDQDGTWNLSVQASPSDAGRFLTSNPSKSGIFRAPTGSERQFSAVYTTNITIS